jgi:hypothetical protein
MEGISMRKLFLLFLSVLAISPAHAWVHGNDVTITNLMVWQDMETTGAPVYFRTSAGAWCYITTAEKSAYAMLMMLYSTGKSADVWCYDTAEVIMGGVSAVHRLHRLDPR